MSTYEYLLSVLRELANSAASGVAYSEHWTPEFSRNQVNEVWRDLGAGLRGRRERRITADEFWTMTPEQMTALGFGVWDDSGLRLIPLWAYNYIADGEELVCISGEKQSKGSDGVDLDTRFGCIPYGFAAPVTKTLPKCFRGE